MLKSLVVNKTKKIIRFDFHCHTIKSDGKQDVNGMLQAAKNENLNFLAITDHNVSLDEIDFEEVYKQYGIRLIPGVELSLLRGHFLIIGIDPKETQEKLNEWKLKPRKVAPRTKKETMKKMLRWAKDNGALIIAAHPVIPSGTMSVKSKMLANLYKEGLVHGAEIHNNDLERRFKSKKLYNFWQRRASRLINKLEIPEYYSSDAHSVSRLGTHFNIIKMRDSENILELLKTGKIKIKHGKNK